MELDNNTIKQISLKKGDHIHFIGIGGSSMAGLAELSIGHGYVVSGSDNSLNKQTSRLVDMGATVCQGHNADVITKDIALVVYTNAVGSTNVEYVKALALDLPVVERGIFLGFIASHYDTRISVSGVHGKTTTTSMLASILIESGKNPSVHLGGVIPWANTNVIDGGKEVFVTEACEYHNNFLNVPATIGILLNLEPEHLDFFGNFENMKKSFQKFADNLGKDGTLIVCSENEETMKVAKNSECNIVTFSISSKEAPANFVNAGGKNILHHFYAEFVRTDKVFENSDDLETVKEGNVFNIYKDGELLGEAKLHVPGMHNIYDAIAAISAGNCLGCNAEGMFKGLDKFHGAKRRFDCVGKYNGAFIISDYAHHPTEVKATIEAAKQRTNGKVIAIFQPHTFSRLIAFRDKYPESLCKADKVIITDVYAAREPDEHIINGKMLSEDCIKYGIDSTFIGPFEDIANFVKTLAKPNDIILILGAGTIDKLAELF